MEMLLLCRTQLTWCGFYTYITYSCDEKFSSYLSRSPWSEWCAVYDDGDRWRSFYTYHKITIGCAKCFHFFHQISGRFLFMIWVIKMSFYFKCIQQTLIFIILLVVLFHLLLFAKSNQNVDLLYEVTFNDRQCFFYWFKSFIVILENCQIACYFQF